MDNYDLLPHDEKKRLKQEIDTLKKSVGGTPGSEPIIESMDNMTQSINALLKIFREAAEDMKLDEHDSVLLSDKIDPLMSKIDKVLEQNEKIAKGIVAIADMIDELKGLHAQPEMPASPRKPQFSAPEPVQREEPPNFPGFDSRVPPMPQPFPTTPIQPDADKKQNFFNIKFK